MTILDQICEQQRREINLQKQIIPTDQLSRYRMFDQFKRRSLKESILDPSKSGIIAEYKRKSPSKGVINQNYSASEIAVAYEEAGASGISVLTNKKYFDGSIEYLFEAKKASNLPVLRKEFIVDEYQIVEAEVIGADAILLICETLTKEEIANFTKLAQELKLEVLVELHSEDQLDKIPSSVDMVGINNRDLKTFKVDFDRSIKMLNYLPESAIKIAESGIENTDQMIELYQAGFDGFLIGETFMKQQDPKAFSKNFVADFMRKRSNLESA